jgi:hypothetical protein
MHPSILNLNILTNVKLQFKFGLQSAEEAVTGIDVDGLTDINQIMHHWFRGKCLLDVTWC